MNRQGAAFAVYVLADSLVVINLPVALGHEVLAGKDRLAVEHTDAPVVLGVEKLLGQQQHRVFEQLGGGLEQGFLAFHLDYATREAAVGDLQHQRETQALADPFEILRSLLVENLGGGHAQLMAVEQVSEVDLVGTAQDRCRVVHDHQAFAFGFFGEAIGVVVDTGGLADQQGVVLGQP